jgi:hypothetical protein
MTTLIAEGFDYAIYRADNQIEVRNRKDDSHAVTVTGEDARDLEACIESINSGLLAGVVASEQAFDLLGSSSLSH